MDRKKSLNSCNSSKYIKYYYHFSALKLFGSSSEAKLFDFLNIQLPIQTNSRTKQKKTSDQGIQLPEFLSESKAKFSRNRFERSKVPTLETLTLFSRSLAGMIEIHKSEGSYVRNDNNTLRAKITAVFSQLSVKYFYLKNS